MRSRQLTFRHLRNSLIFGFLVELLMIKTPIYENIVRRTTMKRLEAKRKEDIFLERKARAQAALPPEQ